MAEKQNAGSSKPRPRIDWEAQSTLNRIEELAALGLTQEQIGYRLGCCRQTISDKKREFPDVADALKRGQAQGIEEIASQLRSLALAGEVGACIFYLKARAGWSDKVTEEQVKQSKAQLEVMLKLCEAILGDPGEDMARAKSLVSVHLDLLLLQAGKLSEEQLRSLHGKTQ